MSIGGGYIFIASFSLLMVRLQRLMISKFNHEIMDESMLQYYQTMHQIWASTLPYLILTGTLFLLYGLFLKTKSKISILSGLILCIISWIWAIVYFLRISEANKFILNSFQEFFITETQLQWAMNLIAILILIVFFLFPQGMILAGVIRSNSKNNPF